MSNPNQDVLLTRNLKLDLLNRTVANTWLRIVSEDVDAALRQCKKTECTRTDVIKTAVERHAYDMHGLLDHERHLLVGPEDGADGSVGLVDLTRLRLHARHLEGVSRGELTATLGAHPDTLETRRTGSSDCRCAPSAGCASQSIQCRGAPRGPADAP